MWYMWYMWILSIPLQFACKCQVTSDLTFTFHICLSFKLTPKDILPLKKEKETELLSYYIIICYRLFLTKISVIITGF